MCVCVGGEFHASATLHPGREPSYPLNSRLCVPQSRCERFGEERDLFLSLRMELRFLGLPVRSLITTPQRIRGWNLCRVVLLSWTTLFYAFYRVCPVEYLESRHAARRRKPKSPDFRYFYVPCQIRHDEHETVTLNFLRSLQNFYTSFDVLLTVHLSIFISVINQLDAQNVCFTISLFHASTCFEHMCSSSHLQVWWYQRLCNVILTSWWWAHVLETCRGMK